MTFTRMKTVASLIAAVAAVGASGAVACSGGSSVPSANEPSGTISLAMSSVGPDGATYALASASLVASWTGSAGSGSTTLNFSTNPGADSFLVPAGSYTASLVGGTPDAQAGWTLTRLIGGTTTTVAAVLLDPQPYTFAITSGGTTNLPLHFEIANVGDVTFAAGTLATTLSVDAGTLPASKAYYVGTSTFTQSVVTPLPSLTSLLNVSSAPTVPMTVSLSLTSPFAFTPGAACANVTGTIAATANPDGGAEDSIAAFLDEGSHGTGTLCFYANSTYDLVLQRTGFPQTSPFQQALGSGFNYVFTLQIIASSTPPLLNGATLSLSQLAEPFTLGQAGVQMAIQAAAGAAADSVTAQSVAMTLQITP